MLTPPRLTILDQGAQWVAVDKPEGLSVHNSEGTDLLGLLNQQIQSNSTLQSQLKLHKPWTLHPVHRLDADTSGVILIALSPERARELMGNWENARKTYLAIAKGKLPIENNWAEWNWALTSRAEGRRDPQGRGERKQCCTRYRVKNVTPYFSYLEIELETGRQHQIRRHAALAKHSLIGDTRYGDPKHAEKIKSLYSFSRLALHAYKLELKIMNEKREITSPVPEFFAKLLGQEM